jgi:hypothetical protein
MENTEAQTTATATPTPTPGSEGQPQNEVTSPAASVPVPSANPAPAKTPAPAKPSLREILGVGKRKIAESGKEQGERAEPAEEVEVEKRDVSDTIHMIMRLAAETKKVAHASIRERLAALDNPKASNKDIHRALQTMAALALPEESSGVRAEAWETASRGEILYGLRDQIVARVLLRNRRAFEHDEPNETRRILTGLTQFRMASKKTELIYASRENMMPGSNRSESRDEGGSGKRMKMAALEETLHTLSQITLGVIRESSPTLSGDDGTEIRTISTLLQNPRNKSPQLPEAILDRKEGLVGEMPALADSLVGTLETILVQMNPDEKSMAVLEREKGIFSDVEDSIGTALEELDSLAKEEYGSVRELEKAYDALNSVKTSGKFEAPNTPEELKLGIFKALREVSGTMGKTTTMVLVAKLAQDNEWVEKFRENGPDAIYHAPAFKNLVVMTEPENTLFGEPENPESYMEEGKTLQEAMSFIHSAEGILATPSLSESLAQKDRAEIVEKANRVLREEITQDERDRDPMLNALATMQENAESMAAAIGQEIEGTENNLAMLPLALREKERQDRIANSLSRSVKLLAKPEVQQALDAALEEENTNLETLQENAAPTEQDRAATVHTKEKIATLEALRDFSREPEGMETKDYQNMLDSVGLTRVPRTLREHALISLCDNKAADGTRLKTKDMLVRLEENSGTSNLTNMVRGDLGILRHWKQREAAPATVRRTELALAICKVPENLKKSLTKEITAALKSCLICPPWKSPIHIEPRDLGNCNGMYLAAKKAYGASSPTFQALRSLHSKTADIQRESGRSLWVRADKLAEDLRSNKEGSLARLESAVLEAILHEKAPKDAIDYMSSWYNSIGHEATLQEDAIRKDDEDPYVYQPLPLVAAKIQTKVGNLLEIAQYLRQVASSSDALAETYIQQRLHEENPSRKEPWESRLKRMEMRLTSEMTTEAKELSEWREKFNGFFEEDDDENPEEEKERLESLKKVCHRKINQKERALEALALKREGIHSLQATSQSLKHLEKPGDIREALVAEEVKPLTFSMESALDQALKLAGSPGKIVLPPKGGVKSMPSPLQMLEAGALEKSLSHVRETLAKAAEILKARDPEAAKVDIETENPVEAINALKASAFRILKEIEIHLWESGKSIKLSREEEEEFLQSNPEMVSARKDWVDTLKKTQEELAETMRLAASLPKEEREKSKAKNEDPALATV